MIMFYSSLMSENDQLVFMNQQEEMESGATPAVSD